MLPPPPAQVVIAEAIKGVFSWRAAILLESRLPASLRPPLGFSFDDGVVGSVVSCEFERNKDVFVQKERTSLKFCTVVFV